MAIQQELVERLFEAALSLHGAEREAFLARECGSDPEVRRVVEELLADDASAGSFLMHPPLEHIDKAAFFDRLMATETAPQATCDTRSLERTASTLPVRSDASLHPGQVLLNRFTIVRFINKGGMGEVYEAEDRSLQRTHIALKIILPHIAHHPSLRERFEREVLLARELTHTNLCPIYDIFPCDDPPPGFLFLTMKLLPGTTLTRRLQQRPPLTPDEKLAVVRQTSAGLLAIHDSGIVHRDIKPSNIMLDGAAEKLRLWITDFGLARALESDTTLQNRTVAGTPGYIAPELDSGHPPSQATDLYAFGVVLHELFTGEKPQTAPDGAAIPSSELKPCGAPSFCIQLVRGCLDLDPKRRSEAFDDALVSLGLKRRQRKPWTRRQFITTAAAGLCTVSIGGWVERNDLYDLMHPLPSKRFVALMAWPPSESGAIVSTLLDSIGDRLARAEAYVKDLLIVSFSDIPGGEKKLDKPADSVSILGANLVLAASFTSAQSALTLTLRVLDAATQKVLRSVSVSSKPSELASLADRGARASARLLSLPQQHGPITDTDQLHNLSPDIFRTFSEAEHLLDEPNNTGIDAAIAKYQAVLAAVPHFALGYARLAMAYIRRHLLLQDSASLELARSNAALALRYNPESAAALLSQALADLYSGHADQAIDYFNRSLRADPRNPDTLLYRAQAYRDLNRWPDAESAYRQIIRERPNYWPAYDELGMILFQRAKYQEAAEAFQSASAAAPEVALPIVNLSWMYLSMGKYSEAREAALRSLKVHPTADAYLNLGDIAFGEGKYTDALASYLKAAGLDPQYHVVWRNIGDCYAVLGSPSKMKDSYAKAAAALGNELRINPRRGNSWVTLAFYHAKTGDRPAAESELKNAEKYGAADIESQFMKAQT
ncbi:MAG: protein kinase, partial [Silvibacterium sp.]|nr:protein kinase [Silvibacterium sp.]